MPFLLLLLLPLVIPLPSSCCILAFFQSFVLFSFFTSALLFLLPSSLIPPYSSHLFLPFLPSLLSSQAILFSSTNCSFVSFSISVPSHYSFIFFTVLTLFSPTDELTHCQGDRQAALSRGHALLTHT